MKTAVSNASPLPTILFFQKGDALRNSVVFSPLTMASKYSFLILKTKDVIISPLRKKFIFKNTLYFYGYSMSEHEREKWMRGDPDVYALSDLFGATEEDTIKLTCKCQTNDKGKIEDVLKRLKYEDLGTFFTTQLLQEHPSSAVTIHHFQYDEMRIKDTIEKELPCKCRIKHYKITVT